MQVSGDHLCQRRISYQKFTATKGSRTPWDIHAVGFRLASFSAHIWWSIERSSVGLGSDTYHGKVWPDCKCYSHCNRIPGYSASSGAAGSRWWIYFSSSIWISQLLAKLRSDADCSILCQKEMEAIWQSYQWQCQDIIWFITTHQMWQLDATKQQVKSSYHRSARWTMQRVSLFDNPRWSNYCWVLIQSYTKWHGIQAIHCLLSQLGDKPNF